MHEKNSTAKANSRSLAGSMVQYLPLQKHRQNNGWTQTLDMTHNKPCCARPLQLLVYQNGNICFTVLLYSSSGSIKIYQNRCFDVFRFRCYSKHWVLSILSVPANSNGPMSSTSQLPQKTAQPAEAQIHPEASRSWQDPGPWSPGAARLVPMSNVLPSAQPFTSLMHQQWHYIMKRVTNLDESI